MRRIVVLGGRGFFGAAAVELFRREGTQAAVASRRAGADLIADAEDRTSLTGTLTTGDVVIDAAGPFQRRSTILVETCLAIGCDVVDIADSLDYVTRIQQLADRIDEAGRTVLTACSSVSAVSAALVRLSGIDSPARLSTILAPATRNTSTRATALSLWASLERPVRVLRDGSLVERRAFEDARTFDFPTVGRVEARLAESADAVTLPRVWPTLRDVDFRVDTRSGLLNTLFAAAARHGSLRRMLGAALQAGRLVTKPFGAKSGGFGIEVEDAAGNRACLGFVHPTHSYIVAVAPVVLAARRIATGTYGPSGLAAADRQVDPSELVDYLSRVGVSFFRGR